MIECNNIVKIFGKGDAQVKALNNVSFKINKAEMIAVTGQSGSGKSTLLNVLGCLLKPTSGEYTLSEQPTVDLTQKQMAKIRNKEIGFVVQDFALIEQYTVIQNVILPLQYAKDNTVNKKLAVKAVIEQLNISEKQDEYVNNLSGGQRQRVAIARAIVNNPKVILADEPTGALDSKTGIDVLNIFKELQKKGKTIVIVTHNHEIASMCDRMMYLRDGELEV